MKPANATIESTNALVSLLELDLGGAQDSVPAHLWERALLGPLREFLARPGKEIRARLVETAWHASGGAAAGPPEVLPLVTEVLHAGSLIIDDIEDSSAVRRGAASLHRLVGLPLALNAGNFLYFWPVRLIDRMALPSRTRLALHQAMGRTLLACHRGQALDLAVRVADLARGDTPAVVRASTGLKTGTLMAFAAASGALAAGARRAVVNALAAFGHDAGVALQMLDDLSGVVNERRAAKGEEDLRQGRPTWVWAWLAEDLDEVSYAGAVNRLRAVLGEGGAPAASLRRWLRDQLEVSGLARVRTHIERSVAAVQRAVGTHPALESFRRELDLLEGRYVRA